MLDFGFYNMDCMEGMKEFPSLFFDLAIVDPPYGINALDTKKERNTAEKEKKICGKDAARKLKKGRLNQGGGKLKNSALQNMHCNWDFEPPSAEYWKELFRVSKNQIIWGGNYFPLPPTRGVIAWDKCQPWENFSQFELAWTSFDRPAALFRYANSGGVNREPKIHPTQKPIALYTWLLKKYAKEDDKILDTHVGSASSLIACKKAGLRYAGFEKDEGYFRMARERMEEFDRQLSLLW